MGKVEVQRPLRGEAMSSMFKTMLLGMALSVPTASFANEKSQGSSISTDESASATSSDPPTEQSDEPEIEPKDSSAAEARTTVVIELSNGIKLTGTILTSDALSWEPGQPILFMPESTTTASVLEAAKIKSVSSKAEPAPAAPPRVDRHVSDESMKHRRWWRAVRFGPCAGLSVDCLAGSFKFDVSPRYVGFSVSTALLWGTATLKAFPLGYRHTDYASWRPYAYIGGGYLIMSSAYSGYGVGADVLVGKSKRLLLQPSAGLNRVSWSGPDSGESIEPAGQVSVMVAF
jgi:hypothetical protein